MSDTVIALREDCILAAEGKSGARPKITDARRIDVEGYGDPLEQWKQALIKYKQECRHIHQPGSHRFHMQEEENLRRWRPTSCRRQPGMA